MEWTGAAAVAAEDEAEGVKQVEGAAKRWRTRNEQGAARRDTQYGEAAARAAAQMRKEAPTAGPEAEMGRTAATRAVAQVMEAMKIGAEAGKRVEEAEVEEGYAKAAEEMGLQEEGQARRQLRKMVEAVMKAQSEGEAGLPTTQAPTAQTRPTAQTETRAAGGEGQQREETDEMKKRRQRFEREAEKPLPPLPLFGEGPQGARRRFARLGYPHAAESAHANALHLAEPLHSCPRRRLCDESLHGASQAARELPPFLRVERLQRVLLLV